jgi:hypothetical protein
MLKIGLILLTTFLPLYSLKSQTGELDIIKIKTTQPIVDDPKTTIDIEIISTNGNSIPGDDKVILQSKAGIEFRGSSSQSFPKKPYGIEIRNADGTDKAVSIFGWPAESDYILFASYNEKSLIHNTLAMHFGRSLGLVASRTRHVEVYINNEYRGIYVFMEKIKRSEGRVDISKLAEKDTVGEGLTGGYIVKMDKNTGSKSGGWQSKYPFNTNGTTYPFYQYEYPEVLHPTQKKYIQDYYDGFEKELDNKNFNPTTGYQKYIDINSFVNLMLLNELTFNVDGYRISTFFHKDKNQKMKAGPAWDYDLSFGNADYCLGWTSDNFSYNFNTTCPNDGFQMPFIWKRLLSDTTFENTLKRKYVYERSNGFLKDDRWNFIIDSFVSSIAPVITRNFNRWPILGVYVWPNPRPVPTTWDGEISELKTWFRNRLNFLDLSWQIKVENNDDVTNQKNFTIKPNPIGFGKMVLTIPSKFQNTNVNIDIFNMSGQKVKSEKVESKSDIITEINQDILPGIYLLRLNAGDQFLTSKFVKM